MTPTAQAPWPTASSASARSVTPQIFTCVAMTIESGLAPEPAGAGSGVVLGEGDEGRRASLRRSVYGIGVGEPCPLGLLWPPWLVSTLSGRLPSFTFTVLLFDPRSSFEVTSSPGFFAVDLVHDIRPST